MLVWVQGSLCHIAAGSHPIQEAWGSQDSLYRGQIQKFLQCCQKPYQQILLVITIQKKSTFDLSTTYRFVDIEERVRDQKFWLYRDQTGKNAPILLAIVSKCSSGKYISNLE